MTDTGQHSVTEVVGVLINGRRVAAPQWTTEQDPDEVNLSGEAGSVRIEQRHVIDDAWVWRIRLRNLGEAPVTVAPVLRIAAAPQWRRRTWLAGADALIAMLPARHFAQAGQAEAEPVWDEPVWAWRLRLGAIAVGQPGEIDPDAPTSDEIVMANRRLRPGEQYAVQWRAERFADARRAAGVLPSWLPPRLELAPRAILELDLPDAAVVGVADGYGLHRILVHHGAGSTELTVSVPYDLGTLIDTAAAALVRRAAAVDGATALLLLHAAVRGSHPEAVGVAEQIAQRPVDDPLAVIAVATGASAAGWNDGVMPAELIRRTAALPGVAGDLARLHVRAAAMVAGVATDFGESHRELTPEALLARLGAGLPGESDDLSPAEVGRLLAWAATVPEAAWVRASPGLAAEPAEIFARSRSWALARLRPGDVSAEAVEALAWLAVHEQLVRG